MKQLFKIISLFALMGFSMLGASWQVIENSDGKNEFHYGGREFYLKGSPKSTQIQEIKSDGTPGRTVSFKSYQVNGRSDPKEYEHKITDYGNLDLTGEPGVRGLSIPMKLVVDQIFDANSWIAGGREFNYNGRKLTLQFSRSSFCTVKVI